MQNYKNLGGDSGVEAYEIGDDYLMVRFRVGKFRDYLYTHVSVGAMRLRQMKVLAEIGKGLNSFINTHRDVRDGYASRT